MTDTRTFLVLGGRPASRATKLLAGVASGGEAFVLALGLRPTPAQQRFVEDALALAAKRRFVLTAETIGDPGTLHARLQDAIAVRTEATRRERRRWHLGGDEVSGAR